MSKFIIFFQIFVLLFLMLTCEKNENPLLSTDPVDSPILFVQCYTNYAWGYQYSGWYVDKEGQIYEVDENTGVKFENINQDSIFSEQMMIELLQSSSKTTNYINHQVLTEMKKLICPASVGQLTEPINVCADFGIMQYFAFIKDLESKGYKAILLFQAGDWAQKNLSQEASELFGLLRGYVENDTTQLPCAPD